MAERCLAVSHAALRAVRATPLRSAALALCAILLGGCDEPGSGPLRVGTNLWPGYEPLYLARQLDQFSTTDVRLVEYASSTQVMRGFRNGSIDAAALTLDEALQLADGGQPLEVVLVMDASSGADAIVARPGIRDLRDLAGRRVAVEGTGVGGYLLGRALADAGMTTADIQMVQLPPEQQEKNFRSGQVDAVVTFEPTLGRLRAAGAVLLFDSSRIPGEIVDVLVVRPGVRTHFQRQIDKLLSGWFRALSYLHEHPAEASTYMQVRLGSQANAREPVREGAEGKGNGVPQALDGIVFPDRAENLFLLNGKASPLVRVVEDLGRHMREHHLLVRGRDIHMEFHPGPLRELGT